MNPSLFIDRIAQELNLTQAQVGATVKLLAEGATVPFIARYRKEATGTLDEVQITAVRDRLDALKELTNRKETVLKSLEERELLTPELKQSITEAETLAAVEDLYLPYRPKRRTRAMIARERGLEPLADLLWQQAPELVPETEAAAFVDAEKEVPDASAALVGARDILAERINDDAGARAELRKLFREKATLRSRVMMDKEQEGAKFRDYFDWSEPAAQAPSHRVLAVRRGEKEGILIMRITPPEEEALTILHAMFVKNASPAGQQVEAAVRDAYKRLLESAMETEARLELKQRADEEAIRVFAENIRELLLAAPLGSKRVLAIDPGFRTGCKIVCLDAQGQLLHTDLIYVEQSQRAAIEAAQTLRTLVGRHGIEAIAIGNGTASRETETFVRKLGFQIPILLVNESGASIYSASDVAREEFPEQDITVRGAVSIGRRLMDPLAELVKIDPKSIGVGQYQHDVDQNGLKRSLDDTVMSCVNLVGVELNTASKQLLSYVSGLNSAMAAGIVAHRNAQGPFHSRRQLLDVPRLGPKAFEQAAGFLRIREAAHPLDASAVHPERYELVERMAADLGTDVAALMLDEKLRKQIRIERYVSDEVGLPTLRDIVAELEKPGRDPRQQFEMFAFDARVEKPEDLEVGMKLPGIVTNVTAFGAFVDIGVHQDGLVHISQLADLFVKDPGDVVKVSQKVTVTVLEVDLERKRIALSMKANPDLTPRAQRERGQPVGRRERSERAGKPAGDRKGGRGNGGRMQDDWFSMALKKGK